MSTLTVQPPIWPVRISETTALVDQATGEVVGYQGRNTDRDRCPRETCGLMCDARTCCCAPCGCEDCAALDAHLRDLAGARAVDRRQPKIVSLFSLDEGGELCLP